VTIPYIVGNWKMNTSKEEALNLARSAAQVADRFGGKVDVGICPPFPWLVPVADATKGTALRLGAQDCAAADAGAFTGEVSAAMIAESCRFTLIGHSERRTIHHESDAIVRDKLHHALAEELEIILCVGESLSERQGGQAEQVVARQLDSALEDVADSMASRLTIAYEPVWAIGTGVAATERDASQMASFVRSDLDTRFGSHSGFMRVLYGGSANDRNAPAFLSAPDVDGLLVGSASLTAESFASMVIAAAGAKDTGTRRVARD
jgi:triosephosphate isomerase (TIM)